MTKLEMEERECREPNCNILFKVSKASSQNGCSKRHDTRGQVVSRRRKFNLDQPVGGWKKVPPKLP